MNKQNTNTILMIRPIDFRFNDQTAVNNYYQKNTAMVGGITPNELAQKEFDDFVQKLRSAGIEVITVKDTKEYETPDSVFPNNWVSFHQDGTIAKYPMYAKNRRLERRNDVIDYLGQQGLVIKNIVDFSEREKEEKYLEGTGSIVLDRKNKIAYAAISVRTDESVLDEFCAEFGYEKVAFNAFQTVDNQRLPIYHTNVMMCVGEQYAVVCMDSIDNLEERSAVQSRLQETGKEIIQITEAQKHSFAGNMLQLENKDGEQYTVMSTAAYNCLDASQIGQLKKYGEIIHSSLSTIEALGGGSARCMMAEVFLPKK